MRDYELLDCGDTWEVGREADRLIGACECGDGIDVPDKGLGRAAVAAWKTRHQDCPTTDARAAVAGAGTEEGAR